MKTKTDTRGLAVVIMAVILFATIFMIPVPNASAAAAATANAVATAGVSNRNPGFYGRYVMLAVVTRNDVISGWDLDDNEVTYMYCTFEDIEGETWVYAYELTDEIPPVNQTVILIMNANDTPQDIEDDTIDDILWACNNEIED